MKILLGKKSLQNYESGLDLIDCIPSKQDGDWIEIDISDRKIEVRLL